MSTSSKQRLPSPTSSTEAQILHYSPTRHHLPFFHPTRAAFNSSTDAEAPAAKWNSRAHRKGRYPLGKEVEVHHRPTTPAAAEKLAEKEEEEVKRTRHRMRLHRTGGKKRFGVWADVSFWVAVIFTFGSIAWIVNGFLVFLPLLAPWRDTMSEHEQGVWEKIAVAWAFVGGSSFEIACYLMVVESLNRGREGSFGVEMEHLLGAKTMDKKWVWWGKGNWRDLGYMASIIQFAGATIFWISTLTGLPGVIPGYPDGEYSVAIVDIFYWVPQVIGGSGFIISSILLMLEVQHSLFVPNLRSLGWHIGLWNLIGGTAFTLCGALGIAPTANQNLTGVEFESANSTFWGSWAFLIGSVIQTWETVYREDPTEKGRVKEVDEEKGTVTETQAS
ncbi:hypothetical protein BT69DRAFT_1268459 [Atractiella rhizophila]|nr:hypothetical protein BT69DRAFT_1268459 [Atractiella rhizophila]